MNQLPRSIEEHIQHLHEKGMGFQDSIGASELLSRVSYSRLKYYWIDLIDNATGRFKEGVTFQAVMERYEFDHKLRVVLFDAIESIEVALRAKIINQMSSAAGNGLWYLDSSLFKDSQRHRKFVLDLKSEFSRSTEPFAKKYIAEHTGWDPYSFGGKNPDAWLIIELATFGTLSKMYKNLRSQLPESAAIAKEFGLYSTKDFSNWIEVASMMRNIVAHHSRLWNRSLAKKASDPKKKRDPWLNGRLNDRQKNKPYAVFCAIAYLCNAINPQQRFTSSIQNLSAEYPSIQLSHYGFPKRWKSEPLWN